jgi:hypothetical protein
MEGWVSGKCRRKSIPLKTGPESGRKAGFGVIVVDFSVNQWITLSF